ncbi:site-specific integrase [Ferrimonas balearica]|uniref:site-specific integrase n=1 Tax=Ferrimonas balearica TaxID=44012 RepID=UPI001C99CD9A|nr:site-specific integrase [Ferrimonas balearica]MBY5990498.1 tyrosine-type recombinase/integrase [Ferrimonas balearica]
MVAFPYLFRRDNGIYYVRYVIPKAYRSQLGLTELRRSLGTNNRTVAIDRALVWLCHYRDFMASLERRQQGSLPTLTSREIAMAKDRRPINVRITECAQLTLSPHTLLSKLQLQRNENQQLTSEVDRHRRLSAQALSLAEQAEEAQRQLIETGQNALALSQSSAEASVRAIVQLEASQKAYSAQVRINEQLVADNELQSCSLQAAWDRYVEIKITLGGRSGEPLSPTTLRQLRQRGQWCVECIGGEKPIGAVAQSDVERIQCALVEAGYSPKTRKHYLNGFSAFFNWAVKAELVQSNRFHGSAPQVLKKEPVIFHSTQLTRLFQHPRFRRCLGQPAYYWLPLLALHSGARSGELGQLRIDDVVSVHGIQCLQIQANHPLQSVKTQAAKRVIPIHDHLLALGWLEYVAEMRASGMDWLFPSMMRGGSSPSSRMAPRFAEMVNDQRIPNAKGLSMHALRRTVATAWRHVDVPEPKAAVLLGHRGSLGFSYNAYSMPEKAVTVLKGVIDRLDFSAETQAVVPFYKRAR